MKIRFFVGDAEPIVHIVELLEVESFFNLINSHDIDLDGKFYKVTSIAYDVEQHIFDVMCEKAEE